MRLHTLVAARITIRVQRSCVSGWTTKSGGSIAFRGSLTAPSSICPFVCVCVLHASPRSSGTGASCIFPLLGAASYGWNFVATEIDPESVASARSNVNANQLQEKVSWVGSEGKQPAGEMHSTNKGSQ